MNIASLLTGGHPYRKTDEKKTVFYLYPELYVILILAFIGGFIDAAGYIKYGGIFTSSITGNLVVACSSIYVSYGVIARVCTSVGFILGGIFGFFLANKLKLGDKWKVSSVSMLLYTLEIALIILTFGFSLNFDQEISSHDEDLSDWRLILAASFMGASMGMHNAAAKESIPNVPATTVMTMTLVAESAAIAQTVSVILADWAFIRLHSKSEKITEEEKKKMKAKIYEAFQKWLIVTRPLVAFLVGAVIGTASTVNITYYSLIIPIGFLITVVFDIYLGVVVDRSAAVKKDEEARKSRGLEEGTLVNGESRRQLLPYEKVSDNDISLNDVMNRSEKLITDNSNIFATVSTYDKELQTNEERNNRYSSSSVHVDHHQLQEEVALLLRDIIHKNESKTKGDHWVEFPENHPGEQEEHGYGSHRSSHSHPKVIDPGTNQPISPTKKLDQETDERKMEDVVSMPTEEELFEPSNNNNNNNNNNHNSHTDDHHNTAPPPIVAPNHLETPPRNRSRSNEFLTLTSSPADAAIVRSMASEINATKSLSSSFHEKALQSRSSDHSVKSSFSHSSSFKS
jgi:uncharacterized membrane protein YoaK (UPF0700 family)